MDSSRQHGAHRGAHIWAIVLCLILLSAPEAWGQADYRNLDPGRPMAIEDAQPIEFRAFELSLGPRYVRGRAGGGEATVEPEIKWGFRKDWQIGISGEYDMLGENRAAQGFTDTQLHLLYNVNQESLTLPALALRPELTIGAGPLGSQALHEGLKVIVSRSFARNRLHLNGAYAGGPDEPVGRGGDLVNRYRYGIAYERTFPLEFLVLLTDVYVHKPIDGQPEDVMFDLGARRQLTPTLVVDAGLTAGAPDHDHALGVTLGLSYVFSYRGLFPTGS